MKKARRLLATGLSVMMLASGLGLTALAEDEAAAVQTAQEETTE